MAPQTSVLGVLPVYGSALTLLSVLGVFYLAGVVLAKALGLHAGSFYDSPITWKETLAFAGEWLAGLAWILFATARLVAPDAWRRAFRKPTWKDAGWIFVGVCLALFASLIVGNLQVAIFHIAPNSNSWIDRLRMSPTGVPHATLVTVGVLVSPMVEEIADRGILFCLLLTRFGPWTAALGSSAIFAAYHFQPAGFASIFTTGLVLVFVFQRTQSLWVPYGVHGMFNAVLFASCLLPHQHHPLS
jgi:membrane protease YdiL (CAAX protease family)